jgi:hypothetical protein
LGQIFSSYHHPLLVSALYSSIPRLRSFPAISGPGKNHQDKAEGEHGKIDAPMPDAEKRPNRNEATPAIATPPNDPAKSEGTPKRILQQA